MYSPENVLRAKIGTVTRREILEYSSARLITASIQSGAIVRLRRGIYGLPDLPEATSVGLRTSGVLSHDDAAKYWKFELASQPDTVHVTVPSNSNAKSPTGVRLHHRRLREDEIFTPASGIRYTTPLRTVLDCASVMSFRDALAVADSALLSGWVRHEELQAGALAFRGYGAGNVRRVAKYANKNAANALESALRAICIEYQLGNFVPQFRVTDEGINYRLDLADKERMIDLEADGYEFHSDRKALHYDHTRNCELIRRGWLVLRFSWEHVMLQPEWVAAVIKEVLQQRRVRPGRRKR